MNDRFCIEEWEDLCSRLHRCAKYYGKQAPQAANEFRQQAEQLSQQEPPQNYPGLLERTKAAARLAVRWKDQVEGYDSQTACETDHVAVG